MTEFAKGEENYLSDIWRRDFIADVKKRRNKAALCAEKCKQNGWYREQIAKQVALYDTVLAAIDAEQIK